MRESVGNPNHLQLTTAGHICDEEQAGGWTSVGGLLFETYLEERRAEEDHRPLLRGCTSELDGSHTSSLQGTHCT
jgi:hypothetical protein